MCGRQSASCTAALTGVKQSSANYIGESDESGQYRAKNQQATTKGKQKKVAGRFNYWRSKFSKGLDRDVIKVNIPKIEQKTIASG